MMINCITRAVLAKLHKNHAVATVYRSWFLSVLIILLERHLRKIRKCLHANAKSELVRVNSILSSIFTIGNIVKEKYIIKKGCQLSCLAT